MRIIFWGTPEYSIPSLDIFIKSKHEVIAVVSQPDKKRSRGNKLISSPVKSIAEQESIKIYTPEKIRGNIDFINELKSISCDLFIVIAYGKILPKEILENPENGTDNNKNNFRFLRVVALLSITDFAFSIDSITTAVAISDQYILIIFGAVIGVLALRFTSGIFLKLLDVFSRLETAGYVAILIVGIKLLLNTLIKESILPDYYFYILILFAFIWGFSKKVSNT